MDLPIEHGDVPQLCGSLPEINVGKTMPCAPSPRKITIFIGGICTKHFQMGGLWHCFTHITQFTPKHDEHTLSLAWKDKVSLNDTPRWWKTPGCQMHSEDLNAYYWLMVEPYPSEKWWSGSQLGLWPSQLFLESHSKFHGSSHHQPVYHHYDSIINHIIINHWCSKPPTRFSIDVWWFFWWLNPNFLR